MTTKSSGFSLVELLVVIAIIGVLSAVGTLTYQGYIAGTKKKTAKNAMMQIALGQTEYYSNEGTYYYTAGDACAADTLVDDNDGIEDELFSKGDVITYEMGYTMCVAEVGTSYLVVAENSTKSDDGTWSKSTVRITLDGNGSFTETDLN